jgi:AcrR family transcriptional regulator
MHDVLQKRLRRSQAERSAATSASLIDATIAILYEKGYAATSTTLVAQQAGVSRGAMLHHFPTKVHLMAAAVYAIYASDIAAYQATLNAVGDSHDRLYRLIDTAWSCFRSPGGIAQTEIWMAARSDPDLAAAVIPVHGAIVRQSVSGLKHVLMEDVQDKSLQAEHILTYLVASLRGLSVQAILGATEAELVAGVDFVKSTICSLMIQST